MKEDKRYKGLQSFGIGVLLLGATAVLSLLRSSTLMMSVCCAAAAVGEFLMAYGALAATKYSKKFRTGGILLLLAAFLRTVGPAIHMLDIAGRTEKMAMLEGGAAALAALLDVLGVIAVMQGCVRVDKERRIGKGLAVIAMIAYPVVLLCGQAVPIILAAKFAGERSLVISGITIAALMVFLVAYLAAAASQNSFRKIEMEYEQEPGTRRHVRRPEAADGRRSRGSKH
ncbi:MAG: hypothetical protein K6B12_02825 [Clostridiales bacterium]|nr:hypothetical protein [Clostridiales bacterium]